ncbi:MAG: ABC transporter ATP-binding protein [Vicinamibacteria bacterium]|nr:ABC transporter ATP-binding protein [Vicinamibacteria bacterium]
MDVPFLTLITILALAPMVLFVNYMSKRAGELMREYHANAGHLMTIAGEAISGIRAVRANDQEAFVSRRFETATALWVEIGRRHNVAYGVVRGVSAAGPDLVAVIIVLLALPFFSTGSMSNGDLMNRHNRRSSVRRLADRVRAWTKQPLPIKPSAQPGIRSAPSCSTDGSQPEKPSGSRPSLTAQGTPSRRTF